jgi:hypothetical protein
MIENDEQLDVTLQALGSLYRALSSLRKSILPVNPRQYALFAEGPLDEISKLQAEINDYLGLTETITHDTVTPANSLREADPRYGGADKS